MEALTKPLYELSASMYQQQADAAAQTGAGGADAGTADKENVVDAEYEVDDKKDNK